MTLSPPPVARQEIIRPPAAEIPVQQPVEVVQPVEQTARIPAQRTPLEQRADSLRKAADSGKYTVRLSSGHHQTLYVFADPFCPHCREIEPVLEALTRDYNVEIFPVTLIGKQHSMHAVVPVLCAPQNQRLSAWQALFLPDASRNSALPACGAGEQAVKINDVAFSYYKLPGTPQLLADDGRKIPLSALTSDDRLAQFLNEGE